MLELILMINHNERWILTAIRKYFSSEYLK